MSVTSRAQLRLDGEPRPALCAGPGYAQRWPAGPGKSRIGERALRITPRIRSWGPAGCRAAHDRRSAGWSLLSALVSGLDAEMARLGYKDSTLGWYRGCWRRLQRYFAARGSQEFSLDLAMAWVGEACGFFACRCPTSATSSVMSTCPPPRSTRSEERRV